MNFAPEQISKYCRELFDYASKALPTEISDRLTCSRAARIHGSYRTVLLFNTWDRYQTDILPKNHFCYCLGFDPNHLISGGSDWYFHLWLNTIRIYRERIAIKSELEAKLREVSFKPFRFEILDRAISIKINFELPQGPESLVRMLGPNYVKIIKAVHPVLIPIIDKFSIYGSRTEVKAEVASRGRIPHRPVRVARTELIREYTRSIPPSWRPEILLKHGYRCVHCDADLRVTGYHLDHKVPFTKGGATVKENLQPLCPPCNTKKGNRSFD